MWASNTQHNTCHEHITMCLEALFSEMSEMSEMLEMIMADVSYCRYPCVTIVLGHGQMLIKHY